jgi:hypothetical protein
VFFYYSFHHHHNTGFNRFELLLSRFDQSRRYEVFTSDMHKETLEENSRIVDQNEKLQRLLSQAQNEILVLKQQCSRLASSSDESASPGGSGGIKLTSAFLRSDGKVPTTCPVGGCSQYESVLRGPDVMKNFQNHMNNTHRVILFGAAAPFYSSGGRLFTLSAFAVQGLQVFCLCAQRPARVHVW